LKYIVLFVTLIAGEFHIEFADTYCPNFVSTLPAAEVLDIKVPVPGVSNHKPESIPNPNSNRNPDHNYSAQFS